MTEMLHAHGARRNDDPASWQTDYATLKTVLSQTIPVH
jgi:hypothetical protein